MSQTPRPTLRLLAGRHRRAFGGYPWIYSNEIAMDAAAKALPAGTVVAIQAADGRMVGAGTFNPHTLIAVRVLTSDPAVEIGAEFLAGRLRAALHWRERLFSAPFYRLIHAEADGLGGLILDRFGDTVVVQGAGAVGTVLAPRCVVLKCDPAARDTEGLESYVTVAKGALDGPIEGREGAIRFLADLAGGQKTGWFYDHRENRAAVAPLARGTRVLDAYCYAGGFALHAAVAGAREVVALDRSADALAIAERATALNGVAERCTFRRADVFEEMERMVAAGERFDVTIIDPPAFAKSRKDVPMALKGYRKLARLGAALTAPGGFLFIASCSHNVDEAHFGEEVRRGVEKSGRQARILRRSGAAPDHPVHPSLPESAYLKAELLALD
ncbi:MAG: class I SAM-dependent rRNA methyltransferase [Alphaproteobacteria bacterium]|nr:class I SAM-dependent rRNA methyltransferase [Alphaproteobacteria bacterium]